MQTYMNVSKPCFQVYFEKFSNTLPFLPDATAEIKDCYPIFMVQHKRGANNYVILQEIQIYL